MPRDWLIASGLALCLVLIAQVPYILGYLAAQPGVEFSGVLMNPEDANSYLAKMEQGHEGAWLYSIPYTAQPHDPAFVGGFYLLLGQLARCLGISILAMWHLSRLFLGLAFCLVAYGFIRDQVPQVRTRWIAYLLTLTSSGLGWVLFLLGQTEWLGAFPIDFKMPEAHLFFTVLAFPHFSAGAAFILVSVWLSLRTFKSPGFRTAIAWGLTNTALAVVYPFLIYLVAVVAALNWLVLVVREHRILWREAWAGFLAFIIPLPLLLYYYLVLRTNPVLAAWDAQAVTPSPNVLHYLVAFGPLLVLALPALNDRTQRGPWLWLLAVAILVYAPLNPQRRFVEGVQVPLSILAAAGLTGFYLHRLRASAPFRWLAARPRYTAPGVERLVIAALIVLLSLSNLYVLASTSLTAAVVKPEPFFHQIGLVQAIDWAGANLPAHSIVLAPYEVASFVPTRTGLRTVIGHWAETPDFETKFKNVEAFYDPGGDVQRRAAVISNERVSYVMLFPGDQSSVSLDSIGMPLTRVFGNDVVTLCRVTVEQ